MRKVAEQNNAEIQIFAESAKEYLEKEIPIFAANKFSENTLSKLNKDANTQIKKAFAVLGINEYSVGKYVAKLSTSVSESLDEERLLELLKEVIKDKIPGSIKTKEYVDMDVLESAIYHDNIPEEVVLQMDNCKIRTEKTALRVTTRKKKEAE